MSVVYLSYLQLAKDLAGQVLEHGDARKEGGPQVGADQDGPAQQVGEGGRARRQVPAAARCNC